MSETLADLLTVAEAAKALDRSEPWLRKQIKKKKVRIERKGWTILIPKAEVAKLKRK
jgi:excisionase family DNA binding protein